MADETDDDWNVACSDDENYGFTIEGEEWLPPNEDVTDLFGKLSKGEKLEFEWKLIARRPPTPEAQEITPEVKEETPVVEENKREVTAFDFDDADFGAEPMTPIRTPGSAKSAKSQRRVARLDKIMDDMFRHKKLNTDGKSGQGDRILQEVTVHSKAAVRASHKASPRQSPKPSSSAFTPRGSPRPYSGSPRPHAGSPRPHTGSPKPSTAAATFTPRGSPRPSSGSPKLSSAPSDTSQPRDSPKSKLSPKRLT